MCGSSRLKSERIHVVYAHVLCVCIYVAVPGRNRTLFHCVVKLHYDIQNAVAQYKKQQQQQQQQQQNKKQYKHQSVSRFALPCINTSTESSYLLTEIY